MKRVLAAWLPRWPLQRLAAARPELNGRPTLLYELRQGGLRVVAFAPSLRRGTVDEPAPCGVRPGMPLAEALALAGLPGEPAGAPLHLEAHDPLADRLALQNLAAGCQRFSPLVGLEVGERPAGLLLDVTGLGARFGGEAALADELQAVLAERGFVAALALCDTLAGAWALARFADRLFVRVVEPGRLWDELARLPTAALRLPEATIACLAELGIVRVGQVAALPRSALLSRFGPELLRRLDQATGAASEVIDAQDPPAQWTAAQAFEAPTARLEVLCEAARRLLEPIARALAARQEGALHLRYALQSAAATVDVDLCLYQPSASPRYLAELLQLRLERLRLSQPVAGVRLTVLRGGSLSLAQRSLWDDEPAPRRARDLAALVDRLTSRLGREAVRRPWLLPDAQPEYACQSLPVDGQGDARPPRRSGSSASGAGRAPGARPLVFHQPALPLAMVSLAPDGPPARFLLAGREHQVRRCWGPERIETGWWRGLGARRDYYRVETDQGRRYWLFRRLDTGRWLLHGEFE